jgi:hypothetical protein
MAEGNIEVAQVKSGQLFSLDEGHLNSISQPGTETGRYAKVVAKCSEVDVLIDGILGASGMWQRELDERQNLRPVELYCVGMTEQRDHLFVQARNGVPLREVSQVQELATGTRHQSVGRGKWPCQNDARRHRAGVEGLSVPGCVRCNHDHFVAVAQLTEQTSVKGVTGIRNAFIGNVRRKAD